VRIWPRQCDVQLMSRPSVKQVRVPPAATRMPAHRLRCFDEFGNRSVETRDIAKKGGPAQHLERGSDIPERIEIRVNRRRRVGHVLNSTYYNSAHWFSLSPTKTRSFQSDAWSGVRWRMRY